MTMVSSGTISIGGSATSGGLNQSINIELGRSATATSSLNESALRTLAGVPSGAISLSNFYGKSNEFAFTISTNQTNANLRTLAVNAGWDQSKKVVATVGSGVEIRSTTGGTPALTINGSFPNGVELVNGGVIVGLGGNGGRGGWSPGFVDPNGAAGGAGGTAVAVSVAVSIRNNATISGGGGGGGGGGLGENCSFQGGGGGGGGGNGYGSGGAAGLADGNGTAGSAGGQLTGGAGGPGRNYFGGIGGNGGAGGTNAASGTAGGSGSAGTGGAGGSGGAAITGNSNVTWLAFGTRYGSIS